MSVSSPSVMHPTLPIEIFYHTCEHLDLRTLRDICLTGRALVSPARTHLFRQISFRFGSMTAKHVAQALSFDPSIGVFVRELTIADELVWPSTMNSLFPLLSNLRALFMHKLVFNSLDGLFQGVLSAIPTLKVLECDRLWIDSCTNLAHSRPSSPLSLSSSSSYAIALDSLTVTTSGTFDSIISSFDSSAFVHHLLRMNQMTCLTSLRLSFGMTDHLFYWMPVVDAAHRTLKMLNITISDRAIPADISLIDKSANPYRYIFDTIAKAHRLSTLIINCYPSKSVHAQTVHTNEVLDALCTLLNRRQTPFPDLSSLHLHVVDRGQVIDPEFVRALARPLTDRARYPAFTRVIVEVCPQVWRGHGNRSKWIPGWGSVDKKKLQAGWRGAFSALEGTDIALHIQFPPTLSSRMRPRR
ncbi:hypothetical protein C8Q80DRAFT_1189758 [Daedaleopsis nitida]|nr:hypothetical protein C8Q80DRAFT_1189758 [Daedaleopsis nitida]